MWLIAQIFNEDNIDILPNTDGSTDINSILPIVFAIAGGIAVIVIIIAAIQYMLSQGDPGKIAQAKNAMIYAAIGLAIVVFAFSIVTFVIGEL